MKYGGERFSHWAINQLVNNIISFGTFGAVNDGWIKLKCLRKEQILRPYALHIVNVWCNQCFATLYETRKRKQDLSVCLLFLQRDIIINIQNYKKKLRSSENDLLKSRQRLLCVHNHVCFVHLSLDLPHLHWSLSFLRITFITSLCQKFIFKLETLVTRLTVNSSPVSNVENEHSDGGLSPLYVCHHNCPHDPAKRRVFNP